MDPTPPTDFALRIRVPGGEPGAIIRLRHALKCLWRTWGIRATSIEPIPGDRPEVEQPRVGEVAQ